MADADENAGGAKEKEEIRGQNRKVEEAVKEENEKLTQDAIKVRKQRDSATKEAYEAEMKP